MGELGSRIARRIPGLSKLKAAGLALFCVLVAAGARGAWHLYARVLEPYQGYSSPEKFVTVPKGYSISQVAGLMESHGLVESAHLFRWYLRLWRRPFAPKAGEYRFSRPLSLIQVADKLHRGDIYYHRVTVPEGLRLEEVILHLAGRGFGEIEVLRSIVRNPEWVADLDPGAEDLEGYLFPETYLWTRDMSERAVVAAMVANFRKVWTPARQRRADELGMSLRQVLTLASLIEKETGLPRERPLVSAVFHNRLRRGMKLACDPTVIYAVRRLKEYDGVLHQSDLDLDSPYNTYRYPGLPPGPIANPGLASLEAALYPADVDYLYFVSRNDGSHVFSTHYRDHQRAVQTYQR